MPIPTPDPAELLRERGQRLADALASFLAGSGNDLRDAAHTLQGGTLFLCGNGGSAAQAIHLEAELVGRYRTDRSPLPAMFLGLSASSSTAIVNDYGDAQIFARPLRGLARQGDSLLAISTSGRSPNVIAALEAARELRVRSVLLSGPGAPDNAADVVLRFPGERADVVQDGHQLVIHALMDVIEDAT